MREATYTAAVAAIRDRKLEADRLTRACIIAIGAPAVVLRAAFPPALEDEGGIDSALLGAINVSVEAAKKRGRKS